MARQEPATYPIAVRVGMAVLTITGLIYLYLAVVGVAFSMPYDVPILRPVSILLWFFIAVAAFAGDLAYQKHKKWALYAHGASLAGQALVLLLMIVFTVLSPVEDTGAVSVMPGWSFSATTRLQTANVYAWLAGIGTVLACFAGPLAPMLSFGVLFVIVRAHQRGKLFWE